jgi:GNAT superfamily N-acetyltransferase
MTAVRESPVTAGPAPASLRGGGGGAVDDVFADRLATEDDLAELREVMHGAVAENQRAFLDPAAIAASRAIMGLDTQLIADRTYFAVTLAGRIVGCGGWSRRATLYGSDQTPGRNAALLDPATEPARIRAMYTRPGFTRRGVGLRILALSEAAAAAEGFRRAALMATLSGEPLYRAAGYVEVERLSDDRGGAAVPLVRMEKALRPPR